MDQAVGERDHTIFLALGITNTDLPTFEIDILNAQAAAFHGAQSGAVEQTGHQVDRALGNSVEQAAYFVSTQDGGQTLWVLSASGLDSDIAVEHFLEQEQKRGERLVLGTRGNMAFDGQIGQEGIDMVIVHIVRVTPAPIPIVVEA